MATTKNKQRKTAKAATKPRAKAAPKSPPKAAPKPPPRPVVKTHPKPVVTKPVVTKPVVTKPVPKAVDKPEPTPSSQPQPFRLVAIERTEPPRGADGKNWYRYTITQGANAINGYLQGTANGVKHAAEQIVGQLNERRAGRWGYRTTRAAAPAQAS